MVEESPDASTPARAGHGLKPEQAAEGGDLPRSVERFTLDEAAETCVSLLTLAWGTYLVGYRGGQARLEEMQLQLMDALILAVLAIRLIDAG